MILSDDDETGSPECWIQVLPRAMDKKRRWRRDGIWNGDSLSAIRLRKRWKANDSNGVGPRLGSARYDS